MSILRKHNGEEWRPEVFELAKSILIRRGLFPQDIEATGRRMEEQGGWSTPLDVAD